MLVPNVTQTPAPKKSNPLEWINVLIVFAAALAGGYFIGQQFANKEDEKETTSEKKDKKSKKDKEDDEDEDEDEKDSKKNKKDNKTSSGSKTIVCSGEFEEMGSISVSFDYSNSKQTITDGTMSMQIDFKKIAGTEITEEQLKEVMKDADLCGEFEDDDRYANCKTELNGTVLNVDLDFDVDEILSDLSEDDKKVDDDELAEEIEDSLNADMFDVTCSVR